METIIEEMKEKLFHNYQTINVEREDIEVRLKAVRDEAESQGRMEGLVQGRQEGIAQVRMIWKVLLMNCVYFNMIL